MGTMKTKDVSELLGVNPTTIQRWSKYFNLVYDTNEHGHYLFTDEHVSMMQYIQQQLQTGKRMRDISLPSFQEALHLTETNERKENNQIIETNVYEQKLDQVMTRVEGLEQKLSQKADEVVSYQLLKHRSELEEMMKMIKKLEQRLIEMESKIEQHAPKEEELPLVVGGNIPKKRWKAFVQLFSF